MRIFFIFRLLLILLLLSFPLNFLLTFPALLTSSDSSDLLTLPLSIPSSSDAIGSDSDFSSYDSYPDSLFLLMNLLTFEARLDFFFSELF